MKVSVLTNFTDLYIYDCSVRPIEGDEISTAMVAHYHFSEYADKFDEICQLLSREAVLSGAFESNFGDIQGAYRREPFDEYFLQQIKSWRNVLGANLLKSNPNIDDDTLNICVQRILNRTIFLRICEDRSFENFETLKQVTTYAELKELFAAADSKYDSGLFEALEEDNLVISDDVIIEIFRSLYYPNNSYEFGVVDPYIIGQIYELFLDETLVVQANGTIMAVEKPEAVDSQGAVNTPKNITDIIVEQTLRPLYKQKCVTDVENYRIADICCGSGNFLLSTFEYIANFYIEFCQTHDLEGSIRRGDLYQLPGGQNYYLSYEIRRNILENNIFGVDIDPLAVEITKFSLLLKALEGTSAEEIDAYVQKTHNRILPNLDFNIKNGNSLVDQAYSRFDTSIFGNLTLLNKIKMFDWEDEFDGKKFDAIVGNPPYIRVQNMVRYSPEEYAFYKSSYAEYITAQIDTLDKYYLFIERGLSLLNGNGMLGYVVPHKFMNIQAGTKLRERLSADESVYKIMHFGTFQAFKNRSTYTCILILSKQPSESFEIGFVQDWNRFLFGHALTCTKYPSTYIGKQPWTFLPQKTLDQLARIKQSCVPLSALAEIFVGVQTSADKIYIVNAEHEDDQYVYVTVKGMNVPIRLEKGILRKSIYDARLTKYEKIEANSYIIYPYKSAGGKVVLYGLEELQSQFPCAYEYLSFFRDKLDKRNRPGKNDTNWFAYGRSQSIKRFMSGEHLIWPVLSLNSNYVFDDEMVVFTGGGNGPFYGLEMKEESQESIFYVQAILNHWLMEQLIKSKASTFRGGYYSHGKQFVEGLPIYIIDFENANERSQHDAIVEKVCAIMNLNRQRKSSPNNVQRNTITRSITAIQRELDSLIDTLYQVEPQKDEE